MKLICSFPLTLLFLVTSLHAKVFDSKETLYTNTSALTGWYTESTYSSIASYSNGLYFVMLDAGRNPNVGQIDNGVTSIESLDKDHPQYVVRDNGLQEFAKGVDAYGYIHVTGPRQGDVVFKAPAQDMDQPTITCAFENTPCIQFQCGSSYYYRYWTGSSWSSELSSQASNRGRLLFNDPIQELLFISTISGNITATSSFTGSPSSYDAGQTFRAFDKRTFYSENTRNGVSWKASSGTFEIIQLKGPNPTYDIINLKEMVEWRLMSSLGRDIQSDASSVIDLSALSEGTYLLFFKGRVHPVTKL